MTGKSRDNLIIHGNKLIIKFIRNGDYIVVWLIQFFMVYLDPELELDQNSSDLLVEMCDFVFIFRKKKQVDNLLSLKNYKFDKEVDRKKSPESL